MRGIYTYLSLKFMSIENQNNEVKQQPYMSVNAQVEGALMAVITVMIGLISFYVPFLFIFNLVGPVPSMLLVMRRGVKVGFLATIVAGCLFSFFAGFREGIIFIISNNLIGLSLGMGIKWKWSITKIILTASLVLFVFNLISIFAFPALMGTDMEQLMKETRGQMVEILKTMKFTNGSTAMTDKELEKFVDTFITQMKNTLIAGLLLSSLLAIIIQYVVAEKLLKKLGYVLPHMTPFKLWKTPWQTSWLFICGYLLWVGVSIPVISIIGMNIFYLCAFVYVVIGLSISNFLMDKIKVVKFVEYILLFFILIFLGNFLLFVGLFDTWFDIRKLNKKEENKTEDKEESKTETK